MNDSVENSEPQTHLDYINKYLSETPIPDSTYDALLKLRETYVYMKATFRIDTTKDLAFNAAEEAYLSGQMRMLELLLQSGRRVTSA